VPKELELDKLLRERETELVSGERIANYLRMARTPDIARMDESKYSQVMKPLVRKGRVKYAVIVGFDSEWNPESRELLSIQFAVVKNGSLFSKVYYVTELSTKNLFEHVLKFLGEAQVSLSGMPKVRIYLIAHFAQSEISKIRNYLKEWKLRVYNKAMSAEASLGAIEDKEYESEIHQRKPVEHGRYGLKILDLYGYFSMALEKVGDLLGVPKVKGVDRSKIHLLIKRNPRRFEAYAKRDAEICAKAFVELRELFLREFETDIVYYPTTAGLAGAIFRLKFLKEPAVPYEMVPMLSRKQKPNGEWAEKVAYETGFVGDRNVRYWAMISYWGGRIESYGRGYLKGDFDYYDIVSIYPSASRLQPLPNKDTRWTRFESLEEALPLEGYCRVRFEFPAECKYPCLPVMPVYEKKLFFPLSGESYCTLAELRTALSLGARIHKCEGYGFKPTEAERNHALTEFMRTFLRLKEGEPEGSLKREIWKLLMNSLIGKFHQASPEYDENYMIEFMKKAGLETLGDPKFKRYLKKPSRVGPCWAPEWATLITGKARALMAEFIAKGSLFCSTDSGLFPKGTNLECEALKQLHSVDSDFRLEHECDSALLVRSRMYALLKEGKVTDCARHGTIASKEDFAKIVLDNLKAGRDLGAKAQKTHLATLKEAVQKGKKLGEQEILERPIKWDYWDGKRELTNPNINLWTEWTETKPLKEIPETPAKGPRETKAEGREHRKHRKLRAPRVRLGRPKALSPEQTKEIQKLSKEGWSMRKLAKRYKVGVATIKRAME